MILLLKYDEFYTIRKYNTNYFYYINISFTFMRRGVVLTFISVMY